MDFPFNITSSCQKGYGISRVFFLFFSLKGKRKCPCWWNHNKLIGRKGFFLHLHLPNQFFTVKNRVMDYQELCRTWWKKKSWAFSRSTRHKEKSRDVDKKTLAEPHLSTCLFFSHSVRNFSLSREKKKEEQTYWHKLFVFATGRHYTKYSFFFSR